MSVHNTETKAASELKTSFQGVFGSFDMSASSYSRDGSAAQDRYNQYGPVARSEKLNPEIESSAKRRKQSTGGVMRPPSRPARRFSQSIANNSGPYSLSNPGGLTRSFLSRSVIYSTSRSLSDHYSSLPSSEQRTPSIFSASQAQYLGHHLQIPERKEESLEM